MRQSVLDLRYNIAAFTIAILREDVATPEQAFAIIQEKEYLYTKEDIEDMKALKEEGLTYTEIGEIYGISRDSVFVRVKGRKDRRVSY